MKSNLKFLIPIIILAGCQSPKSDDTNAMDEAFERNAEVVKKDIENWENETPDYTLYAEDFWTIPTVFGEGSDTVRLEKMKEEDKLILEMLDFELVSEFYPLPGVNSETRKPDGSIRYYGEWKVTKPATDTTDAKSGVMPFYGTYDFNEAGKIVHAQGYGDFSGLMMHLSSDSSMMQNEM